MPLPAGAVATIWNQKKKNGYCNKEMNRRKKNKNTTNECNTTNIKNKNINSLFSNWEQLVAKSKDEFQSADKDQGCPKMIA